MQTYLGEFCAHEDEENQSQELARRLHLLPPVCARLDQRSHMQFGSLLSLPSCSVFLLSSTTSRFCFCAVSHSALLVFYFETIAITI